jgi:hypothetical protein
MSFEPLDYRKIPVRYYGKFALLPAYIRGFALLLKHSCDDCGRIELCGKAPDKAIARRCAAEPNERRRIARDINELLRVGYLRKDDDALVVVEQEEDWKEYIARKQSAREQKSTLCGPPTRRTRARIMARDRRTCRYCGTVDARTIDHTLPQTKGGTNNDANLVVACKRCNSRKGARTPEQAGMTLLHAPSSGPISFNNPEAS